MYLVLYYNEKKGNIETPVARLIIKHNIILSMDFL